MKKLVFKIIFFILFIVLSFFWSLEVSDNTISTMYTVAGIMFSIAMSLLVTSNTVGIRNNSIKQEIRYNMRIARNNFIFWFALDTFIYIFSTVELQEFTVRDYSFKFNSSLFSVCSIVFSIFYFIVNFIQIQKLNRDIEDRLDNE